MTDSAPPRPAPGVLLALVLAACPACGLLRPEPPEYPPVVSSDGLVTQDLVVPEEGPVADEGDRLELDYEIRLGTTDEVVDSSTERGVPYTIVLGEGTALEGLDRGLRGMRLRGRRRLVVPPGLAFGAQGLPPRIPPDATLVIDVELLSIEPSGGAP